MSGIRFYDLNGKQVSGFVDNFFLTMIEWAHKRVHDGKHFNVSFTNTCTNIGEQTVIALNTPATGQIHLTMTASITALATAFIYKDTSIDVDEGTEKTPQNRNQQSIITPTVSSIEASPSEGEVTTYDETQAANANITTATEILSRPLGAVSGPFPVGGEARGQQEWILEANTQYAFVINSDDVNDNIHWISLDWYERE